MFSSNSLKFLYEIQKNKENNMLEILQIQPGKGMEKSATL